MLEGEALAALMGAVIGGTLTIIGNILHERWREGRRAEQMSHAIAGEVSALIQIVRERRYVEDLKDHAEAARAGDAKIFCVRVSHDYFPVTRASIENLGMLPADLPLLVPRFLTLAKSVLEDFETLRSGQWDDMPADRLATGYSELLGVLEAALNAAEQIVAVVAVMYGSPHGRYPLGIRLIMLRHRAAACLTRMKSRESA